MLLAWIVKLLKKTYSNLPYFVHDNTSVGYSWLILGFFLRLMRSQNRIGVRLHVTSVVRTRTQRNPLDTHTPK